MVLTWQAISPNLCSTAFKTMYIMHSRITFKERFKITTRDNNLAVKVTLMQTEFGRKSFSVSGANLCIVIVIVTDIIIIIMVSEVDRFVSNYLFVHQKSCFLKPNKIIQFQRKQNLFIYITDYLLDTFWQDNFYV